MNFSSGMDQESKIKERGSQIVEFVLQSRLKDALDLISLQMEGLSDWQLVSQFEDLSREYGYMLQYFSTGAPDGSRQALFSSLQARAYLLSVDTTIARLAQFSMTLFFQKYRQKVHDSVTVESLTAAFEEPSASIQAHENALEKLFDLVWTGPRWTRQEAQNMIKLCELPSIDKSDALFAVSAVLISLFERFDTEKFLFLCHFSESGENELSIRSLTALSLVTLKYSGILPLFPQLVARLSLLEENTSLTKRISSICLALLMTRQTAGIDRRMREEIIPSMLSNPKLGDLMADVIDSDSDNPDWKEWASKSKARDSLMEMTELQMEGADVYMSTFSNLKNYPFFKKLSNWFRVFSLEQPDVRASLGNSGIENSIIGKSMLLSGTFCNSDKYSFALTFSQIPAAQRELISGQLDSQLDQEQMETLSQALPGNVISEKQAIRQYCQDLYRFFNLFSRKHEFENPFEYNLNLLDNKYLSGFFKSSDSNCEIAVWLLQKRYFQESACILEAMERRGDSHCTDYRFYQQMGYAWQKCGRTELAYDSYSKADLLEADNSWTLRHMAACQRAMGNFEHALELLLDAEKLEKDNLSLQIRIGECLADMKRYDEALARFHKVDYLKPDYPKAWRAIAWCAFLARRHDKAQDYYSRLVADGKNGTDFLNAGHNSWVGGNIPQALQYYRKSIDLLGHDNFMTEFDKDIPTLVEMGIGENDFHLMKDCVCHF